GGVGRQRRNLDLTRVRGLDLSAKWMPWHALTITGDFIYNDATIRRTALAPWLVGNRVAQVPRRSAFFGAIWRAPAKLTFTPRLRYTGRQFEDDENHLTLGKVVVADLGISRALNKNIEIFLTGENLANARIETGRSADGVVTVGTPRLVIGGLRGSW
ncbi:MAG: TonB-dependent receptor, partial [Verrucomicrobia bacterium]|nr:TonB-dependent receptor [Verrucomicrobiota bacterium]